ncbi:hypothetical protein [Burkholderia sp. S-53]|uniref:hypothetical protein n=1 Tax=Burkholderia sp. S-53 TaxID=2906514 RepID=UPI0021D24DB0|nr:hypothetical protein [Burkholderia sp. S-53]UXU85776.1 hypothetical protein LXM88_00290 [Burkholderia sp. S-53]
MTRLTLRRDNDPMWLRDGLLHRMDIQSHGVRRDDDSACPRFPNESGNFPVLIVPPRMHNCIRFYLA